MIKKLNREYTGPSPHAVAIRARNPSRLPPDNLILTRREKDDMIAAAVRRSEEMASTELLKKFERDTDKRIIQNQVDRKVERALKQHHLELEERRQELRVK